MKPRHMKEVLQYAGNLGRNGALGLKFRYALCDKMKRQVGLRSFGVTGQAGVEGGVVDISM